MIVVDANLLLYAYDSAAKDHARAREWLEETLSSPDPVGLPWACLLAFLRIGTNPRALARPFSIGEATAIVGSWLAQPCVTIAEPGERHWELLSVLLAAGQVRGPLVSDAHLAALTIEHGATLATTDRDFSRFDGLRTVNPLAPR